MTKEEWMIVREQPEIPLGVWFSFYKERGGTYDDPILFEEAFNYAIKHEITLHYPQTNRMRQVTMSTARYNLFSYYNTIFGL